MTDLGEIGKYDSVISCHALEHLYPHEVNVALKEFLRVLVPCGTAIIIVPDLEGIPPTEQVMYETLAGQVCGLDMYYGYRPLLATQPYMAHHTGFVADTLKAAMLGSGFQHVITRRLPNYQLMAVGVA